MKISNINEAADLLHRLNTLQDERVKFAEELQSTTNLNISTVKHGNNHFLLYTDAQNDLLSSDDLIQFIDERYQHAINQLVNELGRLGVTFDANDDQ